MRYRLCSVLLCSSQQLSFPMSQKRFFEHNRKIIKKTVCCGLMVFNLKFFSNSHLMLGTIQSWSKSNQTLISLFFQFLLLSLAIFKQRQYFLMLQTLKLNNVKRKNLRFSKKKFGRIDSWSWTCQFVLLYKRFDWFV